MSDAYRTDEVGAEARRAALLRRRRDEFFAMPHALRAVVVARQSRAATGQVASLMGAMLLILACWSSLTARIAGWLPGAAPAPLATLLLAAWVVPIVAWALGRARGEHGFTVAMSRAVRPSGDLDADLQRLAHEPPEQLARDMAHRLEVPATAWPFLAACLVLPATVLWCVEMIYASSAWPIQEFEDVMSGHASTFVSLGALGVLGAVALMSARVRQPAWRAFVLPSLAVIAVLGPFAVIHHSVIIGALLVGCVLVAVVSGLAEQLHRERSILQLTEDEVAAASPGLGATLRRLRRRSVAGRPSFGWSLALLAASALCVGLYLTYRAHGRLTIVRLEPGLAAAAPVAEGGRLVIEPSFDEHGEGVLTLDGMPTLARGWRAVLDLEVVGAAIDMIPEGATVLDLHQGRYRIELTACQKARRIALPLRRTTQPVGRIQVLVTPHLTAARCGLGDL